LSGSEIIKILFEFKQLCQNPSEIFQFQELNVILICSKNFGESPIKFIRIGVKFDDNFEKLADFVEIPQTI